MRRVAEIRHLIAHAWLERERAPVAQLGVEFAFEHIEHVAAVAPVIGEVARRILDHAYAEIADVERTPTASPVSPGCVVAETWLQSVTVNGRVGIFMWE